MTSDAHLFKPIREFPVVTKTDRDVESPVLLEFIKSISPVESLLDIGAHWTHNSYASEIRPHIKKYDAIDILADPETEKIVDSYTVGNALNTDMQEYDTVICVSTLEHAGISTYKGDYLKERTELFKRCVDLGRKHVFLSFPVGLSFVFPGELAIIPRQTLGSWERYAKDFKVRERFFYTQGAQAGLPWYEHADRELAVRIPYISTVGNQSICVMEITK